MNVGLIHALPYNPTLLQLDTAESLYTHLRHPQIQFNAQSSGIVHCDNSAVVEAINKRSSKDEAIMHMLRSLFFIEAHHQFHSTAVHIAGSLNNLADNLSRN